MGVANAYKQYEYQSVRTLTPDELVVRLFDEASKQVSMAIYDSARDRVRSFNCISKATDILRELNGSLNMDVAVAGDLRNLYEFLIEALYDAGGAGNADVLKQLLEILNELKSTFRQAAKAARAGTSARGGA